MTKLSPGRQSITALLLLSAFAALGPRAMSQSATVVTEALAVKPPSTANLADLGPVPASQPMTISIALVPDAARKVAMQQFLLDVQSVASGQYHHWLTPLQFAKHFGADPHAISTVSAFAQSAGFAVVTSPSGLRLTLTGTAAQVEAAFSPQIHVLQSANGVYYANSAAPSVPIALASSIAAIDGLDNLAASSLPVGTESAPPTPLDIIALSGLIEANASRVLTISSTACLEDFDSGTLTARQMLYSEAAAQGITVLAMSGCNGRDSASFPATLAELLAVAPAQGITPASSPTSLEPRPGWQAAPGLPQDTLRLDPDIAAGSLAAFSATMQQILAQQPATADGSAPRLGNIAPTIYALSPTAGLFTQPDAAAPGTWEPATGLGVIDLATLAKIFPKGTLSDNVSISASNYAPTHGTSVTLTSTVSDTSGQSNGAVPTGTITFTTPSGTLGSATLVNGSASYTTNQLAGGNYSITANYSGDGTFAAGTSVVANLSVQGEPVAISATTGNGTVVVGGNITVNVTVTSTSGVGTPSGSVTVSPQGTAISGNYTGTLSGSNGTATATVIVPATQAGTIILLVSCTSADPSFTCYTPIHASATVSQATTTTGLTVSPNPPVNGQTTTFTATVIGAASPAPLPSGNVAFYDNGTQLGTGTLTNGTATYTSNSISGTANHSFTAVYQGDANYTTSTSPAVVSGATQAATTIALAISPNPPVYGGTTTLKATISYTSVGTFPTGTVYFFEDGAQIGSAAVASDATATFTSTIITGTQSHTFYAQYLGDSNYSGSTSPLVTTQSGTKVGTTTTLSLTPSSPVQGQSTTLTATIVANTNNGANPTGSVTFYEDGAVIGSGTLNASAQASFTSSTLNVTGSHSFYAVYGGDTNYNGSQSANVNIPTSSGTTSTTTTLTSSSTAITFGDSITFTATVTPSKTVNNTAPTGTVTFYDGTMSLGSAPVNGAGVATLTLTTSPVFSYGSNVITAVYNGDSNYAASPASNPVTVIITFSEADVSVVLTPSTVAPGGSITAVATVTGIFTANNATPVGTVMFSAGTSGSITPATVNLVATSSTTATATYTFTAASTPGSYTILASCTGTNFSCSITPHSATYTVSNSITQSPFVLTLTPSTATYGMTVIATATVSGVTTTNGMAPTGTATFSAIGSTVATTTVAFTPTSSTSATAQESFSAPTPGTYPVSATCTGTNFTCPSTAATASLIVTKAPTVTTLVATPASIVVGTPTLLTATVMPSATVSASAMAPTGTVTFYDNGVSIGMATLSGTTATFATTLDPTMTHLVYAVYSGDTNYLTSSSSTLSLIHPPPVTMIVLTASPMNALAGTNIIYTATVEVESDTSNPNPGTPYGQVTFFDKYNGVRTVLGTVNLTANGPFETVAQLDTTGQFYGEHDVTAVYAGGSAFAPSTSNTKVVELTDYAISFSPPTISIGSGGAGSTTATITPLNNFVGTVTLACTPPSGSATTCTFNPSTLANGGTSVLTVQTTANQAANSHGPSVAGTAAGVSLAGLLLCLLAPRRRMAATWRKLLLALFFLGLLGSATGCTVLHNNATGGSTKGTPLGTLTFSITVAGTDGVTATRHDTSFQVQVN